MTYHLIYDIGIAKKEPKTALTIGSAVHWGIEHSSEDLTEYFKENGSFNQSQGYTFEQLLSEAMVHGYLKHKDDIFNEMLTDETTGEKVVLMQEIHELFVTGELKSYTHPDKTHKFIGIIDLLLLTNKGFIIIDYKTSTKIPYWDDYLDQIYRYIFMLKTAFPDVPIYKIGICNLRKTSIRQRKGETQFDYLKRLQLEYEINDDNYINYHEFNPKDLDETVINDYIANLSRQVDTAELIVDNKAWYINYNAANGQYGKSDFWDIFYRTPDCYVKYTISDVIWNEAEQKFDDRRDCVDTDMEIIYSNNVLYKFEQFESSAIAYYSINGDIQKDAFFTYLKKNFLVNDDLLEIYWKTLLQKLSMNNTD